MAAPAVPLLAHGFRDWLRLLSSVIDASGAGRLFSPQTSLVGIGGGKPLLPDLRFSLSR
jgi:hypothetical protein